MDSDKEINLDELSGRINNLRNLEARESDPGPMEEYLDMDKITIIKMLLAAQDENRQLQARLDKLMEEARLREDRLNKRIDELTRLNRVSSEGQIRLMDQLTEQQRQLKQMSGQYGEMLTELKRQEDLNRIARKEKYASRRQSVKKEGKETF
ncbi:hypothetical protein LPYR103PRE_24450 [Segatella asaccharophila]